MNRKIFQMKKSIEDSVKWYKTLLEKVKWTLESYHNFKKEGMSAYAGLALVSIGKTILYMGTFGRLDGIVSRFNFIPFLLFIQVI